MTNQSQTIGQLERKTQDRVVAIFRDRLSYEYLGNWEERDGNSNIEVDILRAFLSRSGHSAKLIEKAIAELNRAAGSQIASLYDLNKAVYGLLRYGVKVREELGENYQTVWLIDWEHPENNYFAVAEEVTIRG